jgi:hypothetical protein
MKYLKILIASLFLSILYYVTITNDVKKEDITSYYKIYKLSNIDFKKNFYELYQIIFESNRVITFTNINYVAHIFFSLTRNFSFEIFIFLNLLIFSFLSFCICMQKYYFSTFKVFLCLLSLPMQIHMHFVWRQYLAQLIIIFIIYSSFKSKKFFTILICLFTHPSAFLCLLQKNLIDNYEKKNLQFKLFFTIIFILIFFVIGNFIAQRGNIVLDSTSVVSQNYFYLYILLYLIYSLPIFMCLKSIRLENTNFVIFLPILFILFINGSDQSIFPRLISLGCFSSMIIGLNYKPKLINYYSIVSPLIYLLYIFFYRL